MKIKSDFITNSSSTSFILAFKGEYSHKKILKAYGIEKGSPLEEILDDFFYQLDFNELDENQLQNYELEIYGKKIKELKEKGMKIYKGRFSDDEGLLDAFFCNDSFLIESEEICLDARSGSY